MSTNFWRLALIPWPAMMERLRGTAPNNSPLPALHLPLHPISTNPPLSTTLHPSVNPCPSAKIIFSSSWVISFTKKLFPVFKHLAPGALWWAVDLAAHWSLSMKPEQKPGNHLAVQKGGEVVALRRRGQINASAEAKRAKKPVFGVQPACVSGRMRKRCCISFWEFFPPVKADHRGARKCQA